MASAQQAKSHVDKPAWPPLVAVAGWLLPGAGYWMIGQRGRALVVGITIIVLFVLGLLIGGVRELEVPGYGPHGMPISLTRIELRDGGQGKIAIRPLEEGSDLPFPASQVVSVTPMGPIMLEEPLDEIRDKPWSIAQVMSGPIAVAAGAWSVEQCHRVGTPQGMLPIGSRSHSRLNEIGILYTAVAGMLNLMVIIDAAYRASHPQAESAPSVSPAAAQEPIA